MAPKASTSRSTTKAKGKGKQKAKAPPQSVVQTAIQKYQPPAPSFLSKTLSPSLSTLSKSKALSGFTIFFLGSQDVQPQLEVFVRKHGAVVSRLLLGPNEVTHVVLSEHVWYRRGTKSADQLLEHVLNLNDDKDPESRVCVLPLEYIYDVVVKKEPVSKEDYDFQMRETAGKEAFVGSDANLWNIIPLNNDQASTSSSRAATGDKKSGLNSGVGSSKDLGDGSDSGRYEGNGKGKGKAVAASPRSHVVASAAPSKRSIEQVSRLRSNEAQSSGTLRSDSFATNTKSRSIPARSLEDLDIADDSEEDLPHPSTLGLSIRGSGSTSTSTVHQRALNTKTNLSSRDGPSQAKGAKVGSVGKSGGGRPLQLDSSLEIIEPKNPKLQSSSSIEVIETSKHKDQHVKKKKKLISAAQTRPSSSTKTKMKAIRSYSDDDGYDS